MKPRLLEIDRAKGLAIILVVVGHLVSRQPPSDSYWWLYFKYGIYTFHMPFLFCLTGMVMFYNAKPIRSIQDYNAYICKKFKRLIPAYLIFSIVIFLGKYFARYLFVVDNPVSSLSEFFSIFLRPYVSYSSYLWFIYVLFLMFALTPLLLKLFRSRVEIVLAFSLLLHFLPGTHYFAQKQLFEYLVFFILGGAISQKYIAFSALTDRYRGIFMTVFGLSILSAFIVPVPKLITGLFSIPALIGLVRLNIFTRMNLLTVLGTNIFPIYLMNTIFIGLTKAIIAKFVPWYGFGFIISLPLLLLSGVFAPLFVKFYLIKKVKLLDEVIK